MKSVMKGPRRRASLKKSGEKLYAALLMPFWRLMARRNRDRRVGAYIAITGSCGKSTTTMLSNRLLALSATVSTRPYANSEREVLRSMRRLRRPVDFLVQEVSEFPRGTAASIRRLFRPDCAIVTSIGLDHVSDFHNEAGVQAEIATLTDHTPIVCLNADSPHARALATTAKGRVVLFGTHESADLRATNVSATLAGRLCFDLVLAGKVRRVGTRFITTLMLPNVLGALAAVHALGHDLDGAIAALAAIEPATGRLSVHEGPQHTIVLDTIKAPLWSTRLLVADLPALTDRRQILVLGEVSDIANDSHRRYRQLMRNARGTCALVIGVAHAARPAERLAQCEQGAAVISFATLAEAVPLLREQPPSVIVFKGNSMERHYADLAPLLGTSLSVSIEETRQEMSVNPP